LKLYVAPNYNLAANLKASPGRGTPGMLLKVAFVLFLLTLGTLLVVGCSGGEDEKGGVDNAPDAAARPAERAASGTRSPSNIAKAAAAGIDESSIREGLAHLTGASPAPLRGGEITISERGSEGGRRAAAQYMKESFEEMGLPARVLEFTSAERRGFNVEATFQGTGGEKHLWVTAHLDSFYNPGASDDASGLVSILLTAKVLRDLDPEHTIHFVAYDLEEVGLVGSTLYVGSVVSEIREREGEQAILGNLHSDMIGYDEGGFNAVMGTCNRAGSIDEALLRASKEIDSPLKLSEDCLRRSDHQHFWDAGLPATVLIDSTKYDFYPWYHDPGDTVDKLNIPYLRSMIQLTAAATALLATAP
jgi:hypothetical protein